jgi:hypothetical protein
MAQPHWSILVSNFKRIASYYLDPGPRHGTADELNGISIALYGNITALSALYPRPPCLTPGMRFEGTLSSKQHISRRSI